MLARASLEQARTDALKQQFYLERVVDPNVPDLPEYPRAWRNVLTIFGFALCLYFIAWMFIVGILEHAPED
jgi:capsular polysaccharide transport system permease protein